MSFLRTFTKVFALLCVLCVSAWSLGCAQDAGDTGQDSAAEPAGPEAGSVTGGGEEPPTETE